ncbi:YeeE/YedE thiosulfate transporter family protein [Thermosediminibacter litoriperuensis]|uniref:Uncharacterized protein n=1 Tax=Thermosediminibacter litoriperuensis TaxID=291989 RepID=A0A5S5AED4_9FIRM|nr:YeeE/YedE thiosulfate transporter family protein [Thermosediminibacter litoriperuensis]TYP48403.1 hypothetical protein LZ11_02321 [Thermosediminibacter litoriperuensis]
MKEFTLTRKKSQLPYAMVLLLILVLFGIYLSRVGKILAVRWIFGIAFGFVLQRSRFCFTAAVRDPVLTGNTSLFRAVLIATTVAMVGFSYIQFAAHLSGCPVPGMIKPAGVHTLLGGIIFGIGAVLSGGCASGTLMRVGEGHLVNMIALVFFIAGSAAGAYHFGWFKENIIKFARPVFLPDILGWGAAFFGQLAFLLILYWLALWWDYNSRAE